MPKIKTEKTIPKPPDVLQGESLKIWHEFAPRLFSMGWLDELSSNLFGVFCDLYSLHQQCFQEFQEAKRNPKTDKRVLKLYRKILKETWNTVIMFGREFFLVPDENSNFLIIPPIKDKQLCQERIKNIG